MPLCESRARLGTELVKLKKGIRNPCSSGEMAKSPYRTAGPQRRSFRRYTCRNPSFFINNISQLLFDPFYPSVFSSEVLRPYDQNQGFIP
jgi:hypothetical protein